MHDELIAAHGGRMGIADRGLLASALARPRNLIAYSQPSTFDLAAAYAFGIIQDHPFVDGNKRTGFLAAYTFLVLHGWELTAPEPEAVNMALALATGEMEESEFAAWLEYRSISSSND